MDWIHIPFARVDLTNGGMVTLILVFLIWFAGGIVIGASLRKCR